jgi:hypothetical protein
MGRAPWGVLLCLGCSSPALLAAGGADDGGAIGGDPGSDAFPFQLPPPSDARPPDAAACSRSVHLTAVSIARPVPFDVVIVADNSDSLSWSRSSLSAGLGNLLAHVHGHEARFFVLTTTQYGASSQKAISPFDEKPLVAWRDPSTGAAYANPVTDYAQACTDAKGAALACPATQLDAQNAGIFTLNGSWQFQMPPPVAAITPQMTTAELLVQQQKVADAVLALGGGGSEQEQPICTLSRYLAQKPEALPKHVVFLVLTDEDDTSPPDACLAGYQAKKQPSPFTGRAPCTSGCDVYSYYADRPRVEDEIRFTCLPVDDKGTAHPEKAMDKVLQTFTSCATPSTVACPMSAAAKAADECGVGNQVQDCKLVCGPVQGFVYCSLEVPTDAIDLCSQPFDQGGMHYQNLADYCARTAGGTGWDNCHHGGFKETGMTVLEQTEQKIPVVQASSTGEMIVAFKTSADRLFGPRNYSVESIILDPMFSCPLKPGQSFGANLRTLASGPGDVFPLCQDYAPALQRVQGFADYLVQSDFPLDLDPYEDVDSVVVTNRMGMQRTVQKPLFHYDRAAKVLRFDPGVLGAQDDSLSVNVARYCEVVK